MLGDFYDQRLEVIDFYHDLSRRIARMRLLGTAHWTKEDYELAFAIKAGYIRIPHGPLYMPDSYKFDANTDAAVKRGLFSVRRWVGPVGGEHLRRDQDPFPQIPTPQLFGNHYAQSQNQTVNQQNAPIFAAPPSYAVGGERAGFKAAAAGFNFTT